MNSFTKRLLVFSTVLIAFSMFAITLSQAVSYKPWGVPEARRAEYDDRVSQLDRQAEIRESREPRPSAKVWPASHDFGWTQPGQTVTHLFKIDNRGDADLTLRVRNSSSDRILATLDRTVVPPGESARCEVQLTCPTDGTAASDSQGLIDKQSGTVSTNDPLNQTKLLWTQCKSARNLVLPDRIDFGSHDVTESSAVDFLVYSQRGESLELTDVKADRFDVQWGIDDADRDDDQLAGQQATVAKRVHVSLRADDYGVYNGGVDMTFKVDGVESTVTIPFEGRIRPPIGFYGPNIDRRTGISFGTVENDKQHDLFVVVRSRADKDRPIEVLGVEPKELQADLQPLETAGTYRLRVSIPQGCPYLRFNLAQQHGYVHIGDPNSNDYSGTLPVYGVVGDFQKD